MYIASYEMVRAAVVDALLDAPKRPWSELLVVVLSNGERFCWSTGDVIDISTVHKVFVELFRESPIAVQGEILAITDSWPRAMRVQLPWQ